MPFPLIGGALAAGAGLLGLYGLSKTAGRPWEKQQAPDPEYSQVPSPDDLMYMEGNPATPPDYAKPVIGTTPKPALPALPAYDPNEREGGAIGIPGLYSSQRNTDEPKTAANPATPELPFTDYMSQSMDSPYDTDIRFMHHAMRMMAMAGLGQEALGHYALYNSLTNQRRSAVAQNAQQMLASGDLSGYINMHNHEMPGAKPITAYRKNENGTYTLKYADGSVADQVQPNQLSMALGMYGNPQLFGDLLKVHAKGQVDYANQSRIEGLKHVGRVELEYLKSTLGAQAKQLEMMVKAGQKVEMTAPDMTGAYSIYVGLGTPQAQGFSYDPRRPGLGGKPSPGLVPIQIPPELQQGVTMPTMPAQPITVPPRYKP